MMAKKAPTFRPLDKVIWFQSGGPTIAWVINDNLYKPLLYLDGVWHVKVTRHDSEATEGRGQTVNVTRVQPYSQEMWAVCEYIVREREKLDKTEDRLRKGKIPKEFLQESLL